MGCKVQPKCKYRPALTELECVARLGGKELEAGLDIQHQLKIEIVYMC